MSGIPFTRLCLLNTHRSLFNSGTIFVLQNMNVSRTLHCSCKTTKKHDFDSFRRLNCLRWLLLRCGTPHLHQDQQVSSKPADHPVINPLKELQSYVAVPVIPPDEVLFDPSKEEIEKGEELFIPDHKHKIELLKSAVYTDQLPQYELPEVAFIGRSNVGKSALIRAILGEVADIRVGISSKPGHTKTLNFYKIGQALTLVDMPGYGHNMPKHFTDSVEVFLHSRRKLVRTFVLIDAGQGITPIDTIGLNMMEEFKIPYVLVLTKIDKTSQSTLLKNFMTVLKFRQQSNFCFYQPFLTSAYTRDGIPLLQTFIGYVTGSLSIDGL